jgi:hypothetical protein
LKVTYDHSHNGSLAWLLWGLVHEAEPAEISDGAAAADGREAAEIAINERCDRAAGQLCALNTSNVRALLLGDRREAGQRLAIRSSQRRSVANDEDLGMAGQRQVGLHEHAAGAIVRGTEPVRRRRGHYAGSP